jgi:hypothetical protein
MGESFFISSDICSVRACVHDSVFVACPPSKAWGRFDGSLRAVFRGRKWFFWKHLFFLKYTQWQCILSYSRGTAMYKYPKKPYNTLAGFEPGIFCSVFGRDDQYAKPPGPWMHDFTRRLELQRSNILVQDFYWQFSGKLVLGIRSRNYLSNGPHRMDSEREKEFATKTKRRLHWLQRDAQQKNKKKKKKENVRHPLKLNRTAAQCDQICFRKSNNLYLTKTPCLE